MSFDEQDIRIKYNNYKSDFLSIKEKIIQGLADALLSYKFVSTICGRVKDKESFITKVKSKPEKYGFPFKDIEDLIGIRILVIFPSLAKEIAEKVKNDIFPDIEYSYREEKDPKSFGYEGYQSILTIPQDLINRKIEDFPRVFELQVRTLFQHACFEAQHEVKYKNEPPIDDEREKYEYEKYFGWLAASSWGADRILDNLYSKYFKKLINKR